MIASDPIKMLLNLLRGGGRTHMGHGAGAALLHRQAGLGAVERLDLALLVDREDDGVRIETTGAFEPSFLSPYSMRVLTRESSVILLPAIGQTLVILIGGIDLSMAALASLASVLLALALPASGPLGLVGILLLTTGIGALQGYIHARAQVPSFVVTLAGLGLCSGAALANAQRRVGTTPPERP